MPFPDNSFDAITSFHFIRRFDDDVMHNYAEELSRVLAPGGSGLLVEFAPTNAEWLNRAHAWLVGRDCEQVDLRGWGRAAALMTGCGFGGVNLVSLGPPLFPPIPRLAVLFRHREEPDASVPGLEQTAGMVEAR
ncbi:MAG: methyltransferase domain-containing protein [Dehalococcoidia bacterium]|nr:methyltransferase domain-containing protein [Dehalococcoidia bacterium]